MPPPPQYFMICRSLLLLLILPFMHSFVHQTSMVTYCIPDPVLGAGDIEIKETLVLDFEKLTVQREHTQVNIQPHGQEVLPHEPRRRPQSTCKPLLFFLLCSGILHLGSCMCHNWKLKSMMSLPGKGRDPNRLTC